MKKIILILLIMTITTSAYADISFQSGLKHVNGIIYERAHSTSKTGEIYTLSELAWDFQVLMAGGKASIAFDKVGINLEFWKTLEEGVGIMDDYDWMGDRYENLNVNLDTWTHWSWSNIKVDGFTINGSITTQIMDTRVFEFGAVFGFNFENWKFEGDLQDIIYSLNTANGFRAYERNYGGIDAITYNVQKYIPYLGLNASLEQEKFRIDMTINYSPIAYIYAVDYHILRDIFFYNYLPFQQVISGELETKFYFTKNFFISGTGNISHTFGMRGYTKSHNKNTGEIKRSWGSAGYEDSFFKLGLAIGFKI